MLCFQELRGEGAGPSSFLKAPQHLRACGADPHDGLLSSSAFISGGKYQLGCSGSGSSSSIAACGYSRGADGVCLSSTVPSRHLLLGNITWAADQPALEQLFACFGPLESIQLLQDKGCAILNYSSTMQAEAAKAALAGLRMALLTGGRPLEIFYFHPHPPSAELAAAAAITNTTAAPKTAAGNIWAAVPPHAVGEDDSSASCRASRTSTTSSRPESDDAVTVETWRSVCRQGSSATSTSLDASECSDAADLYGGAAHGIGAGMASRGVTPALWLGNLDRCADRYELEALLSPFGPLDGVCFFPDRGAAFASFLSHEDAAAAKAALDGHVAPSLSGNRRLRVEFQQTQDLHSMSTALDPRPLAGGAAAAVADLPQLPSAQSVVSHDSASHTGPRSSATLSRSSSGGRSAGTVDAAAAAAADATAAPVVASQQHQQLPPLPSVTAPAAAAADVPSRHLWLGNILQNVDRQAVEATFSRFGPLESTRVFPDKHFAFVNYLSMEHAVAARTALRGQMVPSLSGARALEIRFQHRRPQGCQLTAAQQLQHPSQLGCPAVALAGGCAAAAANAAAARQGSIEHAAQIASCGAGVVNGASERRSSGGGASNGAGAAGPNQTAAGVSGPVPGSGSGASSYDLEPCRHLWLGNVLSSAKQQDLETVFSRFGPVESVRIFPAKNYAFVNFKSPQGAEAAKLSLGGRPVPSITGTSPLLLRYKRVPADMTHLGRHAWASSTTTEATAGLLPWLLLLQPGAAFPNAAAAAAGGWNADLAATFANGLPRHMQHGGAAAHPHDTDLMACGAAAGGPAAAAACALNDLANNILAQALANANGPTCIGSLAAAGPQAHLMQALALRNAGECPAGMHGGMAAGPGPFVAHGGTASAPPPSSLWPLDPAVGPAGMPQFAGYLPSSAAAAAASSGLLDGSSYCGPEAAAAAALAAEQALFESLAAAGMLAPPLPAASSAAAAPLSAGGDPFADPQGVNALLSAMLLTETHGSHPHHATAAAAAAHRAQ
ncbi:hypothetical protein PLESTB_001062200 [Pleodorina starrii]|uniref:RRM domain-containing protein n=1 Tax=Pleodorina starrii TaxID=330485 RepID=A0A9W6BQ03_9CHLO|nr:hypothetical protein PLESTM_001280100 [Pleodorina starrii]GLC56079.1 hypothetical protein PLESTB_001062200 [Pleodorina starrii]GLC64063.1 hypothetical protein PLESTF_000114300 [Pleodorina starrii]